jgi:putative ubiquitin-RnfH superfamily antitoxin RatB of RatAB toxin-antitoxin module
MAAEKEQMEVEIVYALPREQVVIALHVETDTPVREAIERSGILKQFPEIDLDRNKVGIFGKLTKLDAAPQPGDRIEIYRALIADPKESRRAKAAEDKGGAKRAASDEPAAE